MKLFVPFDTISKSDNDECVVEGYASTEALDSQNEIVTRKAMENALPDWLKFGNIREMHQPSAVGVAVSAEHVDKGLRLCAKVIDPVARKKVEAGVYKGFSIGGRVTNRDKANKAVITGLHLTEISLVDRPANPEALFDVWKADGISTDDADMTKGMYAVQLLASLVEQVNCLTNHSKAEEAMEGDTDSAVPAELQSIMGQLTQALNDMVAEETAELMQDHQAAPPVEVIVLAEPAGDIEKTEKPVVDASASGSGEVEGVEKRGRRNSSSDQKKLNDAHDAIVAAGADCAAMKQAVTEDLVKAQDELTQVRDDLAKAATSLAEAQTSLSDMTKSRDEFAATLTALTKSHEEATAERDDLATKNETLVTELTTLTKAADALKAEVETLKAAPAPMRGKLLAVAKGDDVSDGGQTGSATPPPAPVDKWFTGRPTSALSP